MYVEFRAAAMTTHSDATDGSPDPDPPGVRAGLVETHRAVKQVLSDRVLLIELLVIFTVPVAVTGGAVVGLSRTEISIPLLREAVDPEALVLWQPMFTLAVAAGVELVARQSTGGNRTFRGALRQTGSRLRPLVLWGVTAVVGLSAITLVVFILAEAFHGGPLDEEPTGIVALVGSTFGWTVVTFYVVPVIVFENRGFVSSVRRAFGLAFTTKGAVLALQALCFGVLVVLGLATFIGGAIIFVGVPSLIFAFSLGLVMVGVGVVLVALPVLLIGITFAVHCVARYRLYERAA
ncbi:hypothetical protein K933_14048 [Candidatus Halobonum tyrrellensis G22]|uniref:Uncharacterized protein n=1 Tax=Candidatus Halobonum tyrrellensis G22 TaxID=1324957 RepID=V4HBI3_9EURY|nr:hypothetical protein K933_14048 [Candidatus Halobonum tyrrellensis G22]